jgi:hypothetical protein
MLPGWSTWMKERLMSAACREFLAEEVALSSAPKNETRRFTTQCFGANKKFPIDATLEQTPDLSDR